MVRYRWNTVTDNILCEQDEDGNLLATYTHEPTLYGELISQNRQGTKSYYHFDGQGSTRALTDENGDVTDTATYTAFGEEVAHTGTTENPFRYGGAFGYYTDAAAGHVDVRARVYEPRIARWMSQDPLAFVDGFNRYVFVLNSPPTYADPSGLAVFTVDADAFIPWAWVSIPPIASGVFWSEVKGNDRDFSALPTRQESLSKQFNWIVAESCACRRSNLQNNAWVDSGRGLDSSTRRDRTLFGWVYYTKKGSESHIETATGKCATHFVHPDSCHTNIHLSMTGQSPFSITYLPAAINYDYHVQLFHSGNHVWWLVSGHHDGFPAHEFWLRHNGQVLSHHQFKPPGTHWIGSAARLLGFYKRQSFFDSGDLEVDDVCCCP